MSEREYFSLRYAVPGFTFILIILGLNYSPLLSILRESGTTEVFGVFLSFLSLFAGSAIGFLVAQIWYSYFHWRRIYSNVFKRLENIAKEKLGFESKAEGKDKDVMLSAVLDHILLETHDEKYWKYCQRRWDVFHTLSCTLVSLILGVCLGLIMRIASFCTLAQKRLGDILVYETYRPLLEQFSTLSLEAKVDALSFVFMLISVIALILITLYGRRQVFNEYYPILRILIGKYSEDLKASLRKAFPDFFVKENSPVKSQTK